METTRLENWAIVDADPWKAPEAQEPRLYGKAYNHPSRPDGQDVIVSSITGYDFVKDEVICFSRNYKLGAIDPAYMELYPDIKQTFLDSIKKNPRMKNILLEVPVKAEQ